MVDSSPCRSRHCGAVQFVVIGHPETSRVTAFLEAAREAGIALPTIIPWHNVLNGQFEWTKQIRRDAWMRIESAGRNWPAEFRLLTLGAEQLDEEDPTASIRSRFTPAQLADLSETPGRILALRQWYLGWRRTLIALNAAANDQDRNWTSDPKDIVTLFDKEACQLRLVDGGCPMPPSLGVPVNFADLYERMRSAGYSRAILKSCHSSSASCAVALEFSGARIQAFSTVDLIDHPDGTRLFNVRPGRWYRDLAGVKRLIDEICRQRVQAQAWIPKLGWKGKRVDFRVVTVGGRARHTVIRLSDTPFTNLQLRNTRGNLEEFRSAFGNDALQAVRDAAELAAQCFPRCVTLGVDVVLSSRRDRAWVLEANAFGDHLPNSLVDGWDTYRWQIEFLRDRYVSAIGR
jgi:hypothetical protein